MAYTVGQSGETDYVNTSLGKVTNVVANGGVGGSGEVVNVVSRAASNLTISANTPFLSVNVPALTNYVAGKTDITVTINSNVYVYGITPTLSSSAVPGNTTASALEIIGGTSGDTISIINNGYIAGYGGDGNSLTGFVTSCASYSVFFSAPTNGGPAIAVVSSTGCPVTITNTGYIAGGGGGGGGTGDTGGLAYGGGGGAGGGYSTISFYSGPYIVRAVPTNPNGLNGVFTTTPYGTCGCSQYNAINGGGGGYILPGAGGVISGNVSGIQTAVGGGSGGSGSAQTGSPQPLTINGGSANNNAQTTTPSSDSYQSGGGGGWGGSGGSAYAATTLTQVGSVGGAAIVKNNNTVTANGNIYGAIDTTSTSVSYVISASANKLSLTLDAIPGIATDMDLIIIIAPNVLLYSDDYNTPAFTLESSYTVFIKSLRIIMSTGSAIMGAGGTGGANDAGNTLGGDAISLGPGGGWTAPTILDCTNGYILGGGGGGGYGNNLSVSPTAILYGGGGAGGGNSGSVSGNNVALGAPLGTTASGSSGSIVTIGAVSYVSGGGGGTMRPSYNTTMPIATTIGQYTGVGGSGGGSGAVNHSTVNSITTMPQGGGISQAGQTLTPLGTSNAGGSGGGGGGWGASSARGSRGNLSVQISKAGGKAVKYKTTSMPAIYVINSNNLAGTISS